MTKRRRPKSVNGDRQSNREPRPAGRNGQQSQTPQGPIETVVVQGPTAMPAPVDADEPGRANSSSLPSAAVIGSASEPERTSEQQVTTSSGESWNGGAGAVRTQPQTPAWEEVLENPRGKRGLMFIQKLIESPTFQLPSHFYTDTPKRLLFIAHGITTCPNPPTDKSGNVVGWSQSAQLRAAAILERMDRSNKQALISCEKLRQGRRKKPGLHLHQHQHEGAKVMIVLPHNGRDAPGDNVIEGSCVRSDHAYGQT